VNACPDDARVEAVLDRVADAESATLVRAHVAECAACLARHGASFEVELWAAGIAVTREATATPLARRLERIAVAAALVALALFVARIATTPAEPSTTAAAALADAVQVVAFETRETTTGPDGCFEVRRTRMLAPALVPVLINVEEIRTGRDGVALVHQRFLPLLAAAGE
jgi:hypothetical protein